MTQDEIIEMTRQAGGFDATPKFLETFAKLVRNDYSNKHAQLWLKRIDEAVKAEREACAMLCLWHNNTMSQNPTLFHMAELIRARGEA